MVPYRPIVYLLQIKHLRYKPNFSIALTDDEKFWLTKYYSANKSAAIHRVLRLLMQIESLASGDGSQRDDEAATWWSELKPFER